MKLDIGALFHVFNHSISSLNLYFGFQYKIEIKLTTSHKALNSTKFHTVELTSLMF